MAPINEWLHLALLGRRNAVVREFGFRVSGFGLQVSGTSLRFSVDLALLGRPYAVVREFPALHEEAAVVALARAECVVRLLIQYNSLLQWFCKVDFTTKSSTYCLNLYQ